MNYNQNMPEGDFSPEAPNNTYGAFIEDLKSEDLDVRSDREIRQLVREAQDKSLPDEERQFAKNEIIKANLRAIPYIIKGLKKTGVPPEELVGQGFEVLDRCIDNFDPDYISPETEDQVKFSSYLFTSLRKNLGSAGSVERVDQKITLPDAVENYANTMKKVRELFQHEHHREPNADEWYKATVDFLGEHRSLRALQGMSPEVFDATKTHQIEKRYVPIGKKVGSGKVDSDTLRTSIGNIEDTIVDPDADTESAAIKKVLVDDMEDVLNSLPERERLVLKLHYGKGLNDEGKPVQPMTFSQIAPLLDVTRERVAQLEARALRRLRHPSRVRKIRDYAERSINIDKLNSEEKRYKEIVITTASRLLSFSNRANIIDLLIRLRNGSLHTGKFDDKMLDILFGKKNTYALLERERKLKTSPRVVTSDLLDAFNQKLLDVRSGNAYVFDENGRPDYQRTHYWSKVEDITPEEINKKLDLSESTIAQVREEQVGSERPYVNEEYEKAVDQMAISILSKITPDEFKDMFSRGMHVAGQNGRQINPRVFGRFYSFMDTLGKIVKDKNVKVLDIGVDVADAINKSLSETPHEKRNWMWRDVDNVTFTQADYEKWVEALDEKVKRWK